MGSSSGLLLLGVRYYSPMYGRFWSWDPVPTVNMYGYVGNSATMAIDPSGRIPPIWIIAGIIAVFGAACVYCVLRAMAETANIGNDKRRHCVTACLITARCGPLCGGAAAFGSEILNLFSDDRDASLADLLANLAGVSCGLLLGAVPIIWWVVSPRKWCEDCCKLLHYGELGQP